MLLLSFIDKKENGVATWKHLKIRRISRQLPFKARTQTETYLDSNKLLFEYMVVCIK